MVSDGESSPVLCRSYTLPDRLKVGRRSLKAKILVRFQVRQQKQKSPVRVFFVAGRKRGDASVLESKPS